MAINNQKLKLLYLVKIFTEDTDDQHALTLPQIVDKLHAYGVNAERKTLYQDFELLRDFGVDIIGVLMQRSYYYHIGNRDFELPELKLLVDSVQSAKFIERHQGRINDISVFGQESNPTTWKMAQMNLAIRGIEANLGEANADSFLKDQHATLKADFVMANPPFNMSDWGADKLQDDVRWKYGIPPAGNANFAWLQHMIHHLSPVGKIGMVLANGSLSSQSGGEGTIRENILKADLVECIVALPSQLFYSTGIPVSLWFLNRAKKQPGKTLFIDARNMGTMVTRRLRELTEDDIMKIAGTYDKYVAGELEDEKGFCAVATLDDIAKQDYILTPGRYVGIAETEDDGEPFEEKMARLTGELSEMFKESHRLEEEIRKQLASIGFELK